MISILEAIIEETIKRWKDRQFKKKILYYKEKLNEKRKDIQ